MITTYICKQCNLRWAVKVDKCINCNNKVDEQIGKKLKVAGITQIFNPSTTQPDVPYYVVLVKDVHNNYRPIKTKKQYNIGDDFVH